MDEVSGRGGKLRLIVTATPVSIDGEELVLEVYRDVTAESRMQASYRDLLARERNRIEALSAEVKRRTEELERSLTELRETRRQLLTSEKMSTLGRLVSGIAHELNNPINFIYANVDFLEEYVSKLSKMVDIASSLVPSGALQAELEERTRELEIRGVRTDLDKLLAAIRAGSRRLANIVGDLKTFSHAGRGTFTESDLNNEVRLALALVDAQAKGRVAVESYLRPLPPIICNSPQLGQVVMNLVVNALQAIEGAGCVVVRTSAEDDGVVIEVEDDGRGMSSEVADRVFEPFFTTKEVGLGTGLGLSISYGIVEAHGGTMAVRSAPGKGALFRVWLPLRPPGLNSK